MTGIQRDWEEFALLLIDVQHDFWGAQIAKSFPRFPSNTANLLELCRTQGVEIVHLRASFKPDMSDWMVKYRLRGSIPCVEGTPGIETLPFALEEPGEAVLAKQTFDGFQDTSLLEYLRRQGKRFVLTAGLVTSTCVLFTTASAAQSGFLTAVVEDCCADEPLAHQETLDSYPFIFDRTTVEAIPDRHLEWRADLEKLDEFQAKTWKPQEA
ncbi:MAG: cysteine hydrolase [Anaerolineae bacterium]|nr:cysteine hydrolase [Anaerolineae bacterium]